MTIFEKITKKSIKLAKKLNIFLKGKQYSIFVHMRHTGCTLNHVKRNEYSQLRLKKKLFK